MGWHNGNLETCTCDQCEQHRRMREDLQDDLQEQLITTLMDSYGCDRSKAEKVAAELSIITDEAVARMKAKKEVSQGPTDTPVSPDPLTTGWMGAHYRAIQRQRAEKDS